MEDIEIKAINTAENPSRIWKWYVDHTFVVIESFKKVRFLEHINRRDPHIHFTIEDARANGFTPFLDALVIPQPDNSLITAVYRKLTHIDLYLQFDSVDNLSN